MDVRFPVDAAGAADVDDVTGFAVLDAEKGGGSADELEGCGVVQSDDGFPLLVRHLGACVR